MYEIRAIFETEEKASTVCAILKRMVDVFNIDMTKFTVLPKIMKYEGMYCFYIDFKSEHVYETLNDLITELGGVTFIRAC